MNKYLIFRTDRIGDFLVSAILLKCIKANDPTAHISVVASEKNISIFEIPGENIGRNFGQSKMKVLKNIFNSLLTIFKMKAGIKNKQNKPNLYEII